MPDTYAVIGSLYGFGAGQLDAIRASAGRSVSILIDDQRGQEATPKGFPKAYEVLINAAFADATCKYVWIMGDDAWPHEDCLARTQAVLEADVTVGAVFPVEMWTEHRVLDPQPEQKPGDPIFYLPAGVVEVVTVLPFDGRKVVYSDGHGVPVCGDVIKDQCLEQIFPGMACACIRREAWRAVGGFDHSLGRGYCEDLDWGLRCWKAGFRVLNYRGAWFLHNKSGTYNRLVASGVYRKEEPYEAAERLKVKYPFMWRNPDPQESSREIMALLKGWYEEARELRAHEAPYPPVPVCGHQP